MVRRPPGRPAPRRQRGFILVFLLALLAMGVLYAVVSRLEATDYRIARAATTADALAQAKAALLGFAATYRDSHPSIGVPIEAFGYLPCPDLDGDGSADALDGDCGGTDGQPVIGLLPAKELGLASALDSDGNCLWYAVSGTFKASTSKPTPLNWDTQGQIEVRSPDNGILAAPDDAGGGAAAVIFSAGPPLAGLPRPAATDATPCGVSPTNRANDVFARYLEGYATVTPAPPAARVTGGTVKDANGNVSNNDQIIWITPKEIFARVRARTDFAAYLNGGIANLQAKLSGHLAGYPPDTSHAGDANWLPAANPYGAGTSDRNFYDNWKDHFRYLTCAVAGTYCYTVSGQSCDGALLFGGQGASGNPRQTSPRLAANYFENDGATAGDGKGGLPIITSMSPFTGATAFSNSPVPASRAADVGLCLSPAMIDTTQPAQLALLHAVVSDQPLASVDTANQRIQLGEIGVTGSGAAAAPLFGCVWYPTPQVFGDDGNTLRVSFHFVINNSGDGFTFSVADADPARNPSADMCGASGPAIGYAGNSGLKTPINYPKIGVEFDRRCDAAFGDPGCGGSYRQIAFVYWGDAASLDDDNTHGAGGGTTPLNPADGTSGFLKSGSILFTGTTYYVRIEMARSYDPTPPSPHATVMLRAYVTSNTGFCSFDFSDDLAHNLADIPPYCSAMVPTIADTITVSDIAGASGPPFQRIWLGFTNGQGTNDQRIYIYGLKAFIGP